jgi:hypothetical protein
MMLRMVKMAAEKKTGATTIEEILNDEVEDVVWISSGRENSEDVSDDFHGSADCILWKQEGYP